MSAIAIGAIAGIVCFLCLKLKFVLKVDDSLDVIAVHLVGGLLGSLLLGFFADKSATGVGTDGVFFGGGWGLFADQVVAVAAVLLFSGVVSWILAVAVDKTIGLRVSAEDEQIGLDQTQHAEAAYQS